MLRQDMISYFQNAPERDSTVYIRAEPWPKFTMKEMLVEKGLLPGVISKYGPNRKVTFNKAEMEALAFDEPQGHLSHLFKGRLFRPLGDRAGWTGREECVVTDVSVHPVEQELMFVRFDRHIPGKMSVVPIPVSISGLWGCPGYRKGGHVDVMLPTVLCEVVGEQIPPPLVVDVSNLHLEEPFGKITLRDMLPLLPKDGTVRFAREYSAFGGAERT
ncbi:50S ribosomal protein L25 (General stress protein CTC) [Durusdinium trenchii]|uniref:50S ribosomal protein L25 (General stress protein CTC) n=1 Tax=Durusdinium trenchii TaxID=1381693 RepID=A0ABP0MLM4_9DINO